MAGATDQHRWHYSIGSRRVYPSAGGSHLFDGEAASKGEAHVTGR